MTVLELSDALSEPHKIEKQAVGQIFERETTRERNLEQRSVILAARSRGKELKSVRVIDHTNRAMQRKVQARERRRTARAAKLSTVLPTDGGAGAGGAENQDHDSILKEVVLQCCVSLSAHTLIVNAG